MRRERLLDAKSRAPGRPTRERKERGDPHPAKSASRTGALPQHASNRVRRSGFSSAAADRARLTRARRAEAHLVTRFDVERRRPVVPGTQCQREPGGVVGVLGLDFRDGRPTHHHSFPPLWSKAAVFEPNVWGWSATPKGASSCEARKDVRPTARRRRSSARAHGETVMDEKERQSDPRRTQRAREMRDFSRKGAGKGEVRARGRAEHGDRRPRHPRRRALTQGARYVDAVRRSHTRSPSSSMRRTRCHGICAPSRTNHPRATSRTSRPVTSKTSPGAPRCTYVITASSRRPLDHFSSLRTSRACVALPPSRPRGSASPSRAPRGA